MAPEFVLETRGLTKEFRGFTAVDSVDLRVQKGHIHALIGPNGAGKTTVFNLLTKFQGECEMSSGNPAISLGITLGGSVHLPMGEGGYTNVGGTNAGAIGAELGVADDANGNKMCYVGYCVASGFQFQLPPKAGDAGVGFMLSLWKDAGE